MTDGSDAAVVTLRFADGRGRRLEIEPRDDGRFEVAERVLTKGGEWRPTGTEIAETVSIED
jgi:hypothetical protein